MKPAVLAARKRGVLFDIGHGKGSFAFKTARAMLANGFEPDTISSDVHTLCINGPAYDQVTTLSKFLCLGMPLDRVIAASTVNAAMALKRPELGSLKAGSVGDATILSIKEGKFDYEDVIGEHHDGRQAHPVPRGRHRRQMVAPEAQQQIQEDRGMSAEDKLKAMGLTLPPTPKPLANYVPFKRVGDIVFLSGQGPRYPDGSFAKGKVGRDVTVEQAYEHAKMVGLGLLSAGQGGRRLARQNRDAEAARNGERRGRIHPAAPGDQWLLRSLRRRARREWPPCPLGRRHGLSP